MNVCLSSVLPFPRCRCFAATNVELLFVLAIWAPLALYKVSTRPTLTTSSRRKSTHGAGGVSSELLRHGPSDCQFALSGVLFNCGAGHSPGVWAARFRRSVDAPRFGYQIAGLSVEPGTPVDAHGGKSRLSSPASPNRFSIDAQMVRKPTVEARARRSRSGARHFKSFLRIKIGTPWLYFFAPTHVPG